jgi:hypothetical protein
LQRFLDTPDSLLLTPTAAMAEHLRDTLARAHRPVRPNRILQFNVVSHAVPELVIDGFRTFTPTELTYLENLSAQTTVTATLPDWPGSSAARDRLLLAGFAEQRFDRILRHPARTVFNAPTLAQEVEQIALRILEHQSKGREFREMGILLRVRDPYAPALQDTLARFGIPARFHFARPLTAHPSIQYIAGIIRALLTGWNHADLVKLLRMPINGLGATPAGDHLDFAVRETLPNSGLEALRSTANLAGGGPFRPLFALALWQYDTLPPAEWSTRLKTLRNLIPPPELTTCEQLQLWRSTAAALDAFDIILENTSQALDNSKLPLSAFWPQVETQLDRAQLQVPDLRRNVVDVLDIQEAHHCEFPLAFVPGLTERHFPQHHRDNRPEQERLLFQLALTRATEETILSYSRFNDRGEATLRSFLLEEEGVPCGPTRILPKPVPVAPLDLPSCNEDLRTTHAHLTPTSVESFLQCPFQFFANKTLKLRRRPEKPRDRLNILLQGSILHQAIAENDFDRVFEEQCRTHRVPKGYRTEAVRLELLRYFEAFEADGQWPLAWPSQTERQFQFALTPQLSVTGRIDRLDTGPGNQAIVIDYKYSPAEKIRDRVTPQAGLYLLAAERFFHLEPAGMFFCALRQPIAWEGWHAAIPGLKLGETRTPSALHELMAEAGQQAIEAHQSILAGDKEVRPTDPNKCRFCNYRQICRIETVIRQPILAAAALSGGSSTARPTEPQPNPDRQGGDTPA